MSESKDEIVTKRATIYLEQDLHHALRIKAAEVRSTISDLVNTAVRDALFEDAEDLAAFEERSHEPDLPFEEVLKDLKKRGKL